MLCVLYMNVKFLGQMYYNYTCTSNFILFLIHFRLHSSTDSTAELSVDPMLVFHTAVNNVMPTLGTRPVKKGGRTYQVSRASRCHGIREIETYMCNHRIIE